MLNSMWGKFGQRLNKTQIQAFHDPQAFHRFLDSDVLDVRHVSVINDDMVEVHYQNQKEDIRVSPNLNIFVACFTTCHARLKLYTALEALGERVLYFDTDSVIYLEETPAQFQPTLGSYLGDFTSELDDDEYIQEFVSGGPKNYGYATNKGKVECKVRGFRLNSEGHAQLNYDVMRQNVLDEITEPPPETQTNPNHQNTPDRPGSQALPTVHLPRVQTVSVGLRQESGRSCHLPDLPLWLPVKTSTRSSIVNSVIENIGRHHHHPHSTVPLPYL